MYNILSKKCKKKTLFHTNFTCFLYCYVLARNSNRKPVVELPRRVGLVHVPLYCLPSKQRRNKPYQDDCNAPTILIVLLSAGRGYTMSLCERLGPLSAQLYFILCSYVIVKLTIPSTQRIPHIYLGLTRVCERHFFPFVRYNFERMTITHKLYGNFRYTCSVKSFFRSMASGLVAVILLISKKLIVFYIFI